MYYGSGTVDRTAVNIARMLLSMWIQLSCDCSETKFDIYEIQEQLCVLGVETATAALNLVNGYDFKGKPIIIAYGMRAQDASEIVASSTDSQTDITNNCVNASENE